MNLGRTVQVSVPIVNNTGGRVDDATAHRWAAELLRTDTWDVWALNANEEYFFEQPNLAESESVSVRVFDPEIAAIQDARVHGARVQSDELKRQSITLIAVPAGVRKLLDDNGEKGYEYGWVETFVGPGVERWVYSDGRAPLTHQSVAAGVSRVTLTTGEEYRDPLIGDIWRAGSDLDCTDSKVRALGGCQ